MRHLSPENAAAAAFGVIAALMAGAAGAALAAEAPAAIVMAVNGETDPPLSAMTEIPADRATRLGNEAELTFLHYGRCKLVTVRGGTLTVTRADFSSDGKIVDQKDGPCPHVHRLGGAGPGTVSGGLVMRGAGGPPRWPLNREIILVGDGSDAIETAAIYAEDRPDAPLVKLELGGHRARYPADAASPQPNQRYVLRLTIKNRPPPIDITFVGTPPEGPDLLVVLRQP